MAPALIALLLSLVAPMLIGRVLVERCWPAQGHRASTRALRHALAAGLGLALTGSLLFLIGLGFGMSRNVVLLCDLGLVVAAVWLHRPLLGPPRMRPRLPGLGMVAMAIVMLLLAALLVIHAQTWRTQPHGDGDAIGIWNMRARFLWTAWGHWPTVFAAEALAHVDYPLLLPILVVRGWVWAGEANTLVPQALALAFSLIVCGVLFGALAWFRGRGIAALGMVALLGTPLFLTQGASQTADIPMAGYVLAALVLGVAHARQPGQGLLGLLGLAAGAAAWTKNEGVAFAVLLLGLAAVPALRRRQWRRLAALGAGALLPLAALVWFKGWLAPANDLVTAVSVDDAWARLLDGSRWRLVGQAFLDRLVSLSIEGHQLGCGFAVVFGLRLVAGRAPEQPLPWGAFGVVGAMAALYFGVFLVGTPYNLDWHLRTALGRLLLQVYPPTLFLVFLTMRAPFRRGLSHA